MIHQITRDRILASLEKLYGNMYISFWLNTDIRFITEICKNDQWKQCEVFCKTVTEGFKIALHQRDRFLYICELLEFKQLQSYLESLENF